MSTIGSSPQGVIPHIATHRRQLCRLRHRRAARARRGIVALFVAAAAVMLSACGGGPPQSATSPTPNTITVAAESSLTEAFTQIGKEFEATKPGTKVIFSFGSSATLAAQIEEGAPVDVFAAANPATDATDAAAP